jgi:hypothetical protein
MSWPLNAECPVCFKITDWYAKYTSEANRCKCDEIALRKGIERDLRFTMELQKARAA